MVRHILVTEESQSYFSRDLAKALDKVQVDGNTYISTQYQFGYAGTGMSTYTKYTALVLYDDGKYGDGEW